MQVVICDLCKMEGRGLVKAEYKHTIKGRSDLRLDLCIQCAKDERTMMKKAGKESYVKLAYKCHGIELNDEEAKLYARRL